MRALTQLEHGCCLSQRTLRFRHVTQDLGFKALLEERLGGVGGGGKVVAPLTGVPFKGAGEECWWEMGVLAKVGGVKTGLISVGVRRCSAMSGGVRTG